MKHSSDAINVDTEMATGNRLEYKGFEIVKAGEWWEVKLQFDEISTRFNTRNSGTLEHCKELVDQQQSAINELAKKIGESHETLVESNRLAEEKGTLAIQSAIVCGQLLNKVKDMMPRGKWLPWLGAHCIGISEKTAENYMRLAKSQHVADLPKLGSLRQAYIATGIIKKSIPRTDTDGIQLTINEPNEAVTHSTDETGSKVNSTQKPEPSEFVQAKGMAVRLWHLLTTTTDPDRMAKQIEIIIEWHEDYLAAKQKREDANKREKEFEQAT